MFIMKKLMLVLLLWLCACCFVFGQVSSAKRTLFNEALNTVGKRVPSGWSLHEGMYWKSYNAKDIVGGKDWLALQLNGNIVEQAIVGCAFTAYNAQMRWVSESYDTLVADKWEFISDDDESVLLTKGDKVAYIRIDSDDGYSAFVIFLSVGTALGGNSGAAWTAVDTYSIFGHVDIFAIAYGNNRFVAGGSGGVMATSTDGVRWTAVSNKIFGEYPIYEIVYGNGKFVASSREGKMAVSTNGTTWTAVSNDIFVRQIINTAIAWGNNKFVAVGSRGRMATSTDGVTWTAVSNNVFSPDFDTSIHAIAWGNNRFVAGGSGGKMGTSTNGTTWTAVDVSRIFGTSAISVIVFGNGKFIACGSGGRMATSTNGTTWTAVDVSRTLGTSGIGAVAFGNGKFVASCGEGRMATSTDGTAWTVVTTSVFNYVEGGKTYTTGVEGIAYGNGKFVAIGRHYGKMAYLSD
jgi:hypothetical protein